jgi:acyl-CoA synthetase (AMP-forming)/AMP-acid ligase II
MCLGWGAAVATGAAVALRERFSASHFWNDVRRFDATSFLYVGELCRYLLNAEPRNGERDHRLRVAVGNGLRPDIWERFQERFAIPVIREFYGATEGNTAIVNYQGRPGMIGRLGRSCAVVRCEPSSGEILRNARGFCEEVEPGEIGLLVARISPLYRFDGYVDEEATRKKVVRDVFRRGDRYFDSGDLVQLHPGRWLSFADRVGDTFRWKGENVSTGEVEEVLGAMPGIREVNVYGVKVAHAEGRAGMAAIHVTGDFDLDAFSSFIREQLPGYQRPLFLRVLRGAMRMTATFKHPKVEYRREGFDPQLVEDPLHVLQGERYVPLDAETFERIQKGEVIPG